MPKGQVEKDLDAIEGGRWDAEAWSRIRLAALRTEAADLREEVSRQRAEELDACGKKAERDKEAAEATLEDMRKSRDYHVETARQVRGLLMDAAGARDKALTDGARWLAERDALRSQVATLEQSLHEMTGNRDRANALATEAGVLARNRWDEVQAAQSRAEAAERRVAELESVERFRETLTTALTDAKGKADSLEAMLSGFREALEAEESARERLTAGEGPSEQELWRRRTRADALRKSMLCAFPKPATHPAPAGLLEAVAPVIRSIGNYSIALASPRDDGALNLVVTSGEARALLAAHTSAKGEGGR